MTRSRIWQVTVLVIILTACAPAPLPSPTPAATITMEPTLAPAPSPTPTVGVVPQRTGAEAEDEGRLRLVHAAPESGAVDVYLEQGLLAGRFGFGAQTNPVSITTGTYYLQIVPVGALPDSQVLADTTLAIEQDQSYIVLISGTSETLIISVYREDLSEIPANKARIAFLNAVPRGPNVTAQVGTQPFADVLDFGQVSAGYTIPAAAGTITFHAGTRPLAEYRAALASQQSYTAVLIGQPGAEDTRILLLSTAVETPGQIRFIHAAAEMGPVTLHINGAPFAGPIAYRQTSDWQIYKPLNYTFGIYATDDNSLITETRITLGSNQALEIVLLEDRGRPALRLYPHSLTPTDPRTARLVIVNAAPYAPAVYGQTRTTRLDEIPLIPGGANSRIVDFPASTLEILWVSGEGNSSRVIEWAGELTWQEGHAYTYVITGTDRDPFRLDTNVGVSDEALATAAASANLPTVRVLNVVAEPVALRVRLGDAFVLDNAPHQQVTNAEVNPSGIATLRVGPAGASPNEPDYLIERVDPITTDSLLLLYNTVESLRYAVLPEHDRTLQQGTAALRVINGITGEEAIYISFDLPGILPTAAPVEGDATPNALDPALVETYRSPLLEPGHATEYQSLPLHTYDLYAVRASDDQVLAIVPRLALESQTIYDLILMPDPFGEGYEILLLRTTSDSP